MDSIEQSAKKRQEEIKKGISDSVALNGEGSGIYETLTIEEAQEQIKKGRQFFTKENVDSFLKDYGQKIRKAIAPETKQSMKDDINKQLNSLVAVGVQGVDGQVAAMYASKEWGKENSEEQN